MMTSISTTLYTIILLLALIIVGAGAVWGGLAAYRLNRRLSANQPVTIALAKRTIFQAWLAGAVMCLAGIAAFFLTTGVEGDTPDQIVIRFSIILDPSFLILSALGLLLLPLLTTLPLLSRVYAYKRAHRLVE